MPESFCGSTWISVIAFLATLAARKSLVSRGESAVGFHRVLLRLVRVAGRQRLEVALEGSRRVGHLVGFRARRGRLLDEEDGRHRGNHEHEGDAAGDEADEWALAPLLRCPTGGRNGWSRVRQRRCRGVRVGRSRTGWAGARWRAVRRGPGPRPLVSVARCRRLTEAGCRGTAGSGLGVLGHTRVRLDGTLTHG